MEFFPEGLPDTVSLDAFIRAIQEDYDAFESKLAQLVQTTAENVITERKESENRIEQLVVWLDESSEAVQVCREDGIIVFTNKESCRRLGKTAGQVIGQHIGQVEKAFEIPGSWESQFAVLREQGHMSIQGEHKRADNTTFPVEVSVKYHEHEGIGYALAFISDITERVEHEKKLAAYTRHLEQTNSELDQFAYVVSHDLKSPLRGINNLSEWLEEDIGDKLSEQSRKHFDLLRGRVHRLESLIDGILQYSRAGKSKTETEAIVLPDFVEDIFADYRLENPQVQLWSEGAAALLQTERVSLFQVLNNLISNAIKHNDKPAIQVVVRWTEGADGFMHFVVEDNGPGIEALYHEKIFRIFQTLQARDIKDSTGVGLSVSKKIVEEKGGTIGLKSTFGQGAAFSFSWPVKEDRSSGIFRV